MGVMEAVRGIASRAGLSDEETEALLADGSRPEVDFDQPLPGVAADVLEVFLKDNGTKAVVDEDGLIWSPIIRSGQFALRPGKQGQKVPKPLKIIAGKSKNSREEIGLEDLKDAFEGDAVDVVTVPTSHDNKPLENQGYIRGMKILDAAVTTGPNKGEKVPTLFGGYEFTEPETKKKAINGSIPGRSAGILYDYANTETAKTYCSVVEHVALTPRPWIKGMTRFGRKLSESDAEPESLTLADELPENVIEQGDEITALLAQASQDAFDMADGAQDGSPTVSWTHEDSPNWLRQQVNDILDEARQAKRKSRRNQNMGLYVDEPVRYYRAQEAKHEGDSGGRALISDGYGDGSNHWVAPFKIDDGNVDLSDFSEWQAVKSVYIPDDRDAPERKDEPLSEGEKARQRRDELRQTPRGRLQLAQEERRRNRLQEQSAGDDNPGESTQGGDPQMEGSNGSGIAQLSEEAKAEIKDLQDKLADEKERNERQGVKLDKIGRERQEQKVADFLGVLRALGFDEEHGFTGFLAEIETIGKADDGEPVVVSAHFSEDGKDEVELSVFEALQRPFAALKELKEGTIKLGEQLAQPSEGSESIEAGEEKPDGADGKPVKETTEEELSAKEKAEKFKQENPEIAAELGIPPEPVGAVADTSGSGGESK